MSKFFGGRSDSDTSSDSETDSEPEIQIKTKPTTRVNAAFLFSDDEADEKRVVRSAKEKRYEAIYGNIKTIKNCRKTKDFNQMLSSFEDLQKNFDKAKPVIAKEENGVTPRFYLRTLVEMEDLVNETWEDSAGRKNLSKINGKSLGALRQKLRKYIREGHDEDVAKFRENPDADDDDEEKGDDEDSGDGSDTDTRAKSEEKEAKSSKSKRDKMVDDDDSDSEDWMSEDSSSSSDSDIIASTSTYTRDMFLKKAVDPEKEAKRKEKEDKKAEARQDRKNKLKAKQLESDEEDDDDEGGWISVDKSSAKVAMFPKDAEITNELVIKKLAEIMAARGKKKTNRKEQIELLTELATIGQEHDLGPGIHIKIKFAIIAALFDYNPKLSDAMKPDSWEKCMKGVEELLDLLDEQGENITTGEHILEENEQLDKAPYKIRGCFLTAMERLDEEFIKVLKNCDAHSNEYVDRLKDEPKLTIILDKADKLVQKTGSASEICRIYLKRIEHIYFKFDPEVIEKKNGKLEGGKETSSDMIDRLCKYIYSKDNTDRLRTRAILCHIYHQAIHDNWFAARDLMLMSHLQDSVHHSDPVTQILYNRTMVQLGLCGFRHAEIKDAHNALLDIQLGGRSKELIAQGLLPQRQHEKILRSSEQEKIEKARQMPFHMHINLELLECVYLVSAMLIEIPYLAAHEYDARRRMISKSYYQQLRSSERQALVGPPESMREHIVAASKAMRNGDWRKARDFIVNDKMNAKVWDLFYDADSVRAMLSRKIQEESMRTYLFTFSNVYDSISIPILASMFELEENCVHALVSKMIINEELMASLDQPSQCVVMHRTEPSRVQALALQLSDKVSQLVENNERLLEQRGLGGSGWQNRGWENRGEGGNNRGGGNNKGNRNEGGSNFRNNRQGGHGGARSDRQVSFGAQTYGKAWN